jgi:hypothetical protein
MSHFVSVRTMISDEQLLLDSLRQLGLSFVREEILVSSCGATTEASVSIALKQAAWGKHPRCGFQREGDAFRFISYDGSEELTGDVFQRVISVYASNKALKESSSLSQRGANVSIHVRN